MGYVKPSSVMCSYDDAKWPMGSKAKSRCRLGMLKVNKVSYSYLNVITLENYVPTENV